MRKLPIRRDARAHKSELPVNLILSAGNTCGRPRGNLRRRRRRSVRSFFFFFLEIFSHSTRDLHYRTFMV